LLLVCIAVMTASESSVAAGEPLALEETIRVAPVVFLTQAWIVAAGAAGASTQANVDRPARPPAREARMRLGDM